MKTCFYDNVVKVNSKEIFFPHNIDCIVEFDNCFIVLLMDEVVPDNNIYAYSYDGQKIWGIEEILKFPYEEAYVSIGKVNINVLTVVTYNGIRFTIDLSDKSIISKVIIK